MIELVDFYKSYDDKNFAVKNINLKAEKGKITGLLGLNGAGKTTIIKAITGQHYSSSGTVKITGKNEVVYFLPEDYENALAEIGYVPEILNFPIRLTVCEYLDFYAKQFGKNFDAVEEYMELCKLQEVRTKRIGTLSKGFRQRLAFAQALIHDPENLVLDEPVNGLDPAQIIQMRELIKEISKTRTVLISTHLMQEVEALCDYIYVISGNTVCAKGTESEILSLTGTGCIEDAFLKLTGSEPEK